MRRVRRIEELTAQLQRGTKSDEEAAVVLDDLLALAEKRAKEDPTNPVHRQDVQRLREQQRADELTAADKEHLKQQIRHEWTDGGEAFARFERALRSRQRRLKNLELVEKIPRGKRRLFVMQLKRT